MTDSNVFFRLVWRVNALLILGVALAVCALVGSQLARDLSRGWTASRGPDRGIATPATVPAGRAAEAPPEVLHVGRFARADGPILYAPLYLGRPGDIAKYASGPKQGAQTRNIVFFDSRDGALRRLLPDDAGRILDQTTIARREPGEDSRPVARLYVHVPADSSGDGVLDHRDLQRILVTRPDGSGQVVLAEGVDHFVTVEAGSGAGRTLSYFVRRGGELHYGAFDLATFEPGRSTPVPLPKT
ncbi:hypothetical protein [Enterovirga rhinocerotis]|uniref:Uncharacterized protein n=1 Tax=Enterovirga rhinocerotis TaxID=1339210 RepID=A0A4R7BWT0_9HYPH|nr:hypothetical protein [Enterovirga rhinocerotis]TDR89642.1 hypothetical protein EV668_2477 [Enterovirga rhinocerotis]